MVRENDAEKYQRENWLARKLISNFQKKLAEILLSIDYQTLHEVGCGEGFSSQFFNSVEKANYSGSDVSNQALRLAEKRNPGFEFIKASVYQLPFSDNQFDLVVASEVLEHLDKPEKALREIKRVTKKYTLLTVPNEPFWRIINVLRGKYLRNWGNPPTHINHWSKSKFTDLVSQYFKIEQIKTSLPWLIVLAAT